MTTTNLKKEKLCKYIIFISQFCLKIDIIGLLYLEWINKDEQIQ